MNILISTQHFYPESFYINSVANTLKSLGNSVTILTGKPNYPDGYFYHGYSFLAPFKEIWNGIDIFRLPIIPRRSKSKLMLTLNYISFIFSGCLLGPILTRNLKPDVIYVYATSPLLQALPAIFLGYIKRCPVVINVQDLWPESLQATGYITNKFVISIVSVFVRFIYSSASLIIVSSRPFLNSIDRFNPSANIRYLPNSVDPIFFLPPNNNVSIPSCFEESFTVVFAGNVGSAQGVPAITEAAMLLSTYNDIHFIILGTGSELAWMREQKKLHKIKNMHLLGKFPLDSMPTMLSKASILLLTLADRPIFSATVPNKLQAYMAVGKPIVVCANGEAAKLVSEAECGLSVPAENGPQLAKAIKYLSSVPKSHRDMMAENAKHYSLKNFDHLSLMKELVRHFEDLSH